MPRELEVTLAWLTVVKKLPSLANGRDPTEGVLAFAKVYYPLWGVSLGGKVALLDPLVDRLARVEYREPPRIDGFVERLQESHRKASMFRNMLEAYQNAFPMGGGILSVDVPGLLRAPEASAILSRAFRLPSAPQAAPDLPVVGGTPSVFVKGGVSAIQAVFRSFSEGLEELRLAKSVLRVETESQLKTLDGEIEALRGEYSKEIEATKDLADRTVGALAKKRDEEIEMVASRFNEIREMLLSDLMNLKKAHSAIMREEGYLRKVAAAGVASRLTPGSDMVKLLLGDHASRLGTVKDEASKVQVLVEEIEKEKGRELSAIKDLYDELIRAKSRVISDLQIELEVDVEKRNAEVNELKDLQDAIEKKLDAVIASNEEYLANLEWTAPDVLGLGENALVYLPFYVAAVNRPDLPLIVCPPSVFVTGAPPMGTAYAFEDRAGAAAAYAKVVAEHHLPTKTAKEREFGRRLAQLVKANDLTPSLQATLAAGLAVAREKGWIADARARALEARAARLGASGGAA